MNTTFLNRLVTAITTAKELVEAQTYAKVALMVMEDGEKITLTLVDRGDNFVNVIKEIRAHMGLGLKEAKDLSEKAPVILGTFSPVQAGSFARALQIAGAEVKEERK